MSEQFIIHGENCFIFFFRRWREKVSSSRMNFDNDQQLKD